MTSTEETSIKADSHSSVLQMLICGLCLGWDGIVLSVLFCCWMQGLRTWEVGLSEGFSSFVRQSLSLWKMSICATWPSNATSYTYHSKNWRRLPEDWIPLQFMRLTEWPPDYLESKAASPIAAQYRSAGGEMDDHQKGLEKEMPSSCIQKQNAHSNVRTIESADNKCRMQSAPPWIQQGMRFPLLWGAHY